MNWFNFECFWRNDSKPLQPSKEKKSRLENKKIEYIDNLICSSCFVFVDKLEDYKKLAVIGDDHYGFCCEDC